MCYRLRVVLLVIDTLGLSVVSHSRHSSFFTSRISSHLYRGLGVARAYKDYVRRRPIRGSQYVLVLRLVLHHQPNASPNDATAVSRRAKYLPRPAALDQVTLVEAHETYGETIAAFAESFEGTGQYCARGECWDLASEALKYFDQYDYIPKPVPSISRTHGHLIFRGKASRGGAEQAGRWRGGDTQVRRGDIVEWRTVRIAMPNGGYSTLGLPDHTAVIVSDAVPRRAVSDGDAVKPSELGSLEVIEQSLGSPPKRQTYDLGMFQEGEVWIYRPIGMETYVGAFLSAQCPDNVEATSV